MAKKNNEENLSEYLKKMERNNLEQGKIQSIADAVKEGNRLLEEEEKLKGKAIVDDKKKLDTALSTSSTNPYVKARIQILNGWLKNSSTAWLAHEIEAMENGSQPKDRHYDDFVKMVADLGDTI